MTQNERLLNYLDLNDGIHPLIAWTNLGIYRLSARIKDLRNAGNRITRDSITVVNQFGEECRVAFYRLAK